MTYWALGCVQKCDLWACQRKWKKGQKLSCVKLAICPDHPRRHRPLKFCAQGRVREVVIYFKLHENRSRGLGAVGGRKSPSPIDLAHGLYNSLYYRTSRDQTNKKTNKKLQMITLTQCDHSVCPSQTCMVAHKNTRKTTLYSQRQMLQLFSDNIATDSLGEWQIPMQRTPVPSLHQQHCNTVSKFSETLLQHEFSTAEQGVQVYCCLKHRVCRSTAKLYRVA